MIQSLWRLGRGKEDGGNNEKLKAVPTSWIAEAEAS